MALTKEDREEIRQIASKAIDSVIEKLSKEEKRKIISTYDDVKFRKKMLTYKAEALTYFEKWGNPDIDRLAKQFQLKKEGGKWIPIKNI